MVMMFTGPQKNQADILRLRVFRQIHVLIKSLKGIGSEFYNLLEKLYATGCISDLSQCNADVASLVYFIDKESTAYSAYCEGDRDKAEKLFTEVSQSDFI